ncbi:MAG: SPOR domain-containing protein [Gemmatimonadaceae bacterium]
MTSRIVHGVLLLAVLSACGGDDTPQSLSQAGDSAATTPPLVSAPPPAATGAPATTTPPAPRGGGQPAVPAMDAAAASELASARHVFTVQVGSFQNDATAQSLRARLERDGVPAWTAPGRLYEEDYTRVRVGAAVSAGEARAVADKVRSKYRWPVWIAVVDDKSTVTVEMLNATRSYAGGM